jgi:DNA topoisomerase I
VLEGFWSGFREQIEDKAASVTRAEAVQSRDLGADPKSGRPVSVRMGRFGPIVQIGTKDDEEKPRFAGLLPGQKMDQVTLDEALTLFQLPRELGETVDGDPVQVNVGRFGPYVKYGRKFASLGPDDDVWTVGLPRALEIIAEKQAMDAQKYIRSFPAAGIEVINGRYGPYITDGKKNAKIPKDQEPAALTLEQCQELLASAPERRGRTSAKGGAKATGKAAAKTSSAARATKAKGNGTIKAGTGKTAARKGTAGTRTAKKPAAKTTAAKKASKPAGAGKAGGSPRSGGGPRVVDGH